MSLPKINEEIKYVQIPLPSGKTIGVRGWKVKDEKELLFALESDQNGEDNKVKHIISFLKNCVDDQKKFDNVITESDIKKICIEVRKLSKGELIEYNYTCGNCGFSFSDEVNLTKNQEVKNFDVSPLIINDDLTVTFRDLDWKTSEKLVIENTDSNYKFTFKYIINSINSITYKGTTYTTFTPKEVEEFIDQLDSDDLKKLFDEFDKKASSVELVRKITCLKCKSPIEVNFGDFLSFLVL